MQSTFQGFRRENGRVGVRNHVIILPVDDLSNAVCEAVAHNVKGAMAIPHPYGRLQFGADLECLIEGMESVLARNRHYRSGYIIHRDRSPNPGPI